MFWSFNNTDCWLELFPATEQLTIKVHVSWEVLNKDNKEYNVNFACNFKSYYHNDLTFGTELHKQNFSNRYTLSNESLYLVCNKRVSYQLIWGQNVNKYQLWVKIAKFNIWTYTSNISK